MYIASASKKGRPDDFEKRLKKEQKVYEMLDILGIEYDYVDHDEAMTIEACKDIEKVLGVGICKNLFLCNLQKTDFYLLLIDVNKRFKTSVVSKIIGTSRLSFGDANNMLELFDITPVSLSVFGLMNDTQNRVKLLIDKSVLDSDYFGCHPCINTSTLKIKTADIIEKCIPFMAHEPMIIEIPEEAENDSQ